MKEIQNETLVNSFMLCSALNISSALAHKVSLVFAFSLLTRDCCPNLVLFPISFVPFCDDDHAGLDHHALLTELFLCY